MQSSKVYAVSLADIKVGDANVRQHERDKDIDELAASIRTLGLLQPVVLKGEYGRPPYELVIGQRRYLAHQQLGETEIRALFAGDLDDTQAKIRSLAENVLRVELNHADAAEAVADLYERFGKDERRVQNATALSLRMIREYLDIKERASERMLDLLRAGQVTRADVKRALATAADDIPKAERILEKMPQYGLTGSEKTRLVKSGQTHPEWSDNQLFEEAQRPKVEDTFIVRLPESLRRGLEVAMEALALEATDVFTQALEEWLSDKGFLRGS
jgi:ParB family chromosome partitioning protein